ncbi:methyl-accepting chemotaxis protein [Desulfosporosinus hippei]|uniref:Methyl-accepting chemotaxis protein (MCP) signalling domain-containing protein n=1 Tax=Desulfosporosinus hippei DSM 8344 TaxID=1121419 RepID=A0A1G8I108_9FIRM|nr:methyl-accepting chemotaxis protein [Desulfosporosinus hippei]SDI12609.1 Methyl-accepting chemotaxis protein (MCP) signalling domain-containing protein [Desulfosporosinus hippei DSM 8344]
MEDSISTNTINENDFFEIIGKIASLFHQVIPIENTVIVTDREKFRHYFMGTEAVISKSDLVGSPIPTRGHIPISLTTGAHKVGIVPKEQYGVAFKSSTMPIKDWSNSIIGTLTLALSLKGQTALQEITENISSSAEQLSATTEDLASSALVLSENIAEVLSQTQDILKLIEQTNNILDFVKSVATNSRLLGLNAAIEAARAGDFGRGFTVVADEIRKMAENSAKSVNDSKTLISTINDKVNHLMNKVEELTSVALTQAAANQEMTATIQSFAATTQNMRKVSEII